MSFHSAALECPPSGECGPLGCQVQSTDAADTLRLVKSVKRKDAAPARAHSCIPLQTLWHRQEAPLQRRLFPTQVPDLVHRSVPHLGEVPGRDRRRRDDERGAILRVEPLEVRRQIIRKELLLVERLHLPDPHVPPLGDAKRCRLEA
jgi:hypothetical protein